MVLAFLLNFDTKPNLNLHIFFINDIFLKALAHLEKKQYTLLNVCDSFWVILHVRMFCHPFL